MQPITRFCGKTPEFWAQVKLISMEVGYSARGSTGLRRYSLGDIEECFGERSLSASHLKCGSSPSIEGQEILDYLNIRADLIESYVRPNLMNREEAKAEFELLLDRYPNPKCALPFNKQKGDKRHHAYLTCIVNLLTERCLGVGRFDDSPRRPLTVISEQRPSRTLSRWMDGAYPAANNPIACWEIKEYYGTTTFGSRVADGVYESMLDGNELSEVYQSLGHKVQHYLIVDDRFTWWDKGRSYLCRLVDMAHAGLVDEVLYGREVLSRWPEIVSKWPSHL